jgi:RND family efflux transporter MFP subunit
MKLGKRISIVIILIVLAGIIWFFLRQNKQVQKREVAFAAKQIDAIPVKTKPVEKFILGREIEGNGFLQASNQLVILSETQGRIVHLFKETGDFVRKGDVIAKVEDKAIKAMVEAAEANVMQQEKDMKRFKRLDKGNAITKHDVEEARIQLKKAKADLVSAREALRNTAITSPVSGYINQKFVSEGQFLTGGTPVCEVVDNSVLKLNVEVSEKDVSKIQRDQSVSVQVPTFPGEEWDGKVSAVAEKADQSMNFKVEITLENGAKNRLRTGMYAEVHIPVPEKQALVIPKECIIGSLEKPVVFVVEGNLAKKRSIITGEDNNNLISVISGLKEGEQVIYSGQINLSGNDKVKVIN